MHERRIGYRHRFEGPPRPGQAHRQGRSDGHLGPRRQAGPGQQRPGLGYRVERPAGEVEHAGSHRLDPGSVPHVDDAVFRSGQDPVGVVDAAQAPEEDQGPEDRDPGQLVVALPVSVAEDLEGVAVAPEGAQGVGQSEGRLGPAASGHRFLGQPPGQSSSPGVRPRAGWP